MKMIGPEKLTRPEISTKIMEHAHRGNPDFDFSNLNWCYPNGAVPAALALDFLKRNSPNGLTIHCGNSDWAHRICNPIDVSKRKEEPWENTIWRFSTMEDVAKIASNYTATISLRMECEEGVCDTLDWCFSEVMDNVSQHGKIDNGLIMMQVHKQRVAVAVADAGVGIVGSWVSLSEYKLPTVIHGGQKRLDSASIIAHAVKKGSTSNSIDNMGNGLFGLSSAVAANGGELWIRSAHGTWSFTEEGERLDNHGFSHLILSEPPHLGTVIDFQIDCSHRVRIDEIFGKNHSSSFLEKFEPDDSPTVQEVLSSEILASDYRGLLSTREGGKHFSNLVKNLINQGSPVVIIDFSGISIITASFADEVFGKNAKLNLKFKNESPGIKSIISFVTMMRS